MRWRCHWLAAALAFCCTLGGLHSDGPGGELGEPDAKCALEQRSIARSSKSRFTVLVADLLEDDLKRHTEVLVRVLREQYGLDVIRTCMRIDLPDDVSGMEERIKAEAIASRILANDVGMVLVGGKLIKEGKLRVWFLLRQGKGVHGSLPYLIDPIETLPNFPAENRSIFIGLLLASIKPPSPDGSRFRNSLLKEHIDLLRSSIEKRPDRHGPEQRTALSSSLGIMTTAVAGEEGDSGLAAEAVKHYTSALTSWPVNRGRLSWAVVQNNLGNALQLAGRPLEATDAYRNALRVWTKEGTTRRWAKASENLGNALATVGLKTDRAALEAAKAAYNQAADGFAMLRAKASQVDSVDWAGIQYNLAIVREALWESGSDVAELNEAQAGLRAAVEIFRREDGATWHMAKVQAKLEDIRRKLARLRVR